MLFMSPILAAESDGTAPAGREYGGGMLKVECYNPCHEGLFS